METNERVPAGANWSRRSVILAIGNCVLLALLVTGLRQRSTSIAEASMVPTPLPASPTSTPVPPTATPVPCPDDAPVAIYRADEHHIYLEGASNPSDAEVFIEQLTAVVGVENITNNYILDDCLPSGVGGVVRIEDGILFDYDSSAIRPEFESVLDLVAVLVETFPVSMMVEGHTDDAGADDYNLELSAARANAVADYLVDSGIDEQRIGATGFGESQPIDDNTTEAGRSRNRRIEFRLVNEGDTTEPFSLESEEG